MTSETLILLGESLLPSFSSIQLFSSLTSRHSSLHTRHRGFLYMPPGSQGETLAKVDRTTRWGNPFVQGRMSEPANLGHPVAAKLCGVLVRDRAHAVELFQKWIFSASDVALAWRNSAPALHGKNLACWCPLHGSCHADILLQLANPVTPHRPPDSECAQSPDIVRNPPRCP
jgi:hypothetical protein